VLRQACTAASSRQNDTDKILPLSVSALETLDRDEAVDGLQDRLEVGREVEIILAVFRLRPDLEDHGDHGHLSCR
jgi:hypothetical protein